MPTSPMLVVNMINKLHPSDFETNPLPYSSILTSLTVTGFNSSGSEVIGNVICSGIYDYLEIV
ncbi:MAG: hypothetical protein ACKOPP_02545 [Bacteroidota bacterium]